MKIGKIVAVASLAVAAAQVSVAQAASASVCTGGNAGSVALFGGAGAPVASAVFVKTGFNAQCSNNVIMKYEEVSAVLFAVGSASVKGNQRFKGNSNGGAIGVEDKCSAAACAESDVNTALSER